MQHVQTVVIDDVEMSLILHQSMYCVDITLKRGIMECSPSLTFSFGIQPPVKSSLIKELLLIRISQLYDHLDLAVETLEHCLMEQCEAVLIAELVDRYLNSD